MHKITLLCSAHRENGLCNAGELLKILRAIEPDVIFEEIRPSDFDAYYKHGTQSILEVQAIESYCQFKPCQQIPVDRYHVRYDLLAAMKRDLDHVIDYVGWASEEYQLLDELHTKGVRELGFRYLNSVASAATEARMSAIEDTIVRGTGNPDAMRVLERWRDLIQRREFEMVANIYEYCRSNVFDTGVFLVGAAHKTAIVKEIERYASTEPHLINWNSAYDGQVPDGAPDSAVS